jgi:hypothetical protein
MLLKKYLHMFQVALTFIASSISITKRKGIFDMHMTTGVAES